MKNSRYHIENLYPFVISLLLVAGIAYSKVFKDQMPTLVNQLADNALSISVTLFGFLLTILTLINSIDTRRMKFVRDLGAFPRLILFLKTAIYANLLLLASSFLIKYIEHRDGSIFLCINGSNIFDLLFILCFIYAMLVSLRFTHIFISLLTDKKA